MTIRLTPHFTLPELERSQTAARLGIDNRIPQSMMGNALRLCELLERIRAALGHHPVTVTSGYRCPEVNRRVGGARGSHHTLAAAADIVVPGFGPPIEVANALAADIDELGVGQLIAEFCTADGGGWTHVGVLPVASANRVLTIDADGTRVGIHQP